MARTTSPSGLPSLDAASRKRLLQDVLKGVSRSFYLTLRILPKTLREPVGLAYLLARTADTISDRRAGFSGARLDDLLVFRQQLLGRADLRVLRELSARLVEGGSPEDRAMFDSMIDSFSLLEALDVADREQVRWVVTTLTQGMEMDLTVFPSGDSGGLGAFPSAADLDKYTYLVAGCVGEFWTKATTAHESSLKGWDVEKMSATGVRFGKALQLTNVLRDIPRDLRNGRCYLPAAELSAVGLAPEDLLDPANESQARAVLEPWLQTVLGHFQAAEDYLTAVPRRSVRLRLACLWPLLLGLATLARLARSGKWLDPDTTVKVGRGWVYRMMLISFPAVGSNFLLRRWIGTLRRRVEQSI